MPETLLAKTEETPIANAYFRLRERVRETLIRGQARARALVEREKVRTYWEIGRHIDRHIRAEKKSESARATYGRQVIQRLADDLRTNKTQLYDWLRFAKAYRIFPPAGKLTWSHYRALLSVDDDAKREALTTEASRAGWSRRTLEAKIWKKELEAKNLKGAGEKTNEKPPRFMPKRGTLYTYRVIPRGVRPGLGREAEGSKKPALVLDLGFYFYDEALGTRLGRFREGDIVRAEFLGANPFAREASFFKAEGVPKSHLYTYTALLERVVDIDTFWMYIRLGFGMAHRQKLRLRGVDGPELGTPEGDQAKRWVEERLKGVETYTVTTTKPDKWARFLADIYFKEGGKEVNLNQLLLQEGLVRRKEDYSEADWRKWEGKGS